MFVSLAKVGDHTPNLDYDGTNALYLPTTAEASAAVVSMYDESVDADPTLPAVWSGDTLGARASVRVSGDVVPKATGVSTPTTPNGTYGVGQEIDIEVFFTTPIFVKNSHTLPSLLVAASAARGGEAKVSLPMYFTCH